MNSFLDLLSKFWDFVSSNWLAFFYGLYEYEEKRVADTEIQAQKKETDLEVSKANEAIDAKYADKSDLDTVRDAISSGGGDPATIAPSSGTASETNSGDGNSKN